MSGTERGLTARGLDAFAAALAAHPTITVDTAALWKAFADAFPQHPRGAAERQWLLDALAEAERRGVITLPPAGGTQWDRMAQPPVPLAVRRRRDPKVPVAPTWRILAWHPALQWVPAMASLNAEETDFLRRVHDGLVSGAFTQQAPLKHRSLALTGREKRLGMLLDGRLFEAGRLTLDLLGAVRETPPLAWTVLSETAHPRVLVFENAGPTDLALSILSGMPERPYDVVAYGAGKPFPSSIVRLRAITPSVIDYVGDLDHHGVAMAASAAVTARSTSLPDVTPAPGFHRAMLEGARDLGHEDGWRFLKSKSNSSLHITSDAALAWLPGEVRAAVAALIAHGRRIPEEVLSPRAMTSALVSIAGSAIRRR